MIILKSNFFFFSLLTLFCSGWKNLKEKLIPCKTGYFKTNELKYLVPKMHLSWKKGKSQSQIYLYHMINLSKQHNHLLGRYHMVFWLELLTSQELIISGWKSRSCINGNQLQISAEKIIITKMTINQKLLGEFSQKV